ncbi:MAG: hypothetical protein ACREBG_22270 [Pyrinomonadaceae bacterium]
MLLRNMSLRRIIQYRLGCVIKKGDKFKLICDTAPKQIDLLPYNQALDATEYSVFSIPDELIDTCKKRLAKIAIVQVIFDDGSEWRLDRDRHLCPTPHVKKARRGRQR